MKIKFMEYQIKHKLENKLNKSREISRRDFVNCR